MSSRTFPVAEIFGPTIQGEGALAGKVTHFVRFGGCDYSCEWCDSSHAVLSEQVRSLPRLTDEEIALRVFSLEGTPDWVTFSGGNPALQPDLGELIGLLHIANYKVAVETQGSVWRDWLRDVDLITVSPKPPSSGMLHWDHLREFMARAPEDKVVLKVVVFQDWDYEYARDVHRSFPNIPMYLSVGTLMGGLDGDYEGGTFDRPVDILQRYRWLAECVLADSDTTPMGNVTVYPQLHVLIWGHVRGR